MVIPRLAMSFFEGLVDNVFRDTVLPKPGSVLYCDLAFGYAEHSGIYVGNNEIVHLNGDGRIESVSYSTFLDRKASLLARSIYISCIGTESVGSQSVADRARSMIGQGRKYNMILDNCHQFTAGCLLGDFENSSNFLMFLKNDAKKVLGTDTWRVWTRET